MSESQPSDPLTEKIIGAAIEVHRHLGPGLLESAYEQCLAIELVSTGLMFDRQAAVPITYKGQTIEPGFRADFIVEDAVLLELKAIEKLVRIHETQVLTYLKLSGLKTGLLMNFSAMPLKAGIRRLVM